MIQIYNKNDIKHKASITGYNIRQMRSWKKIKRERERENGMIIIMV